MQRKHVLTSNQAFSNLLLKLLSFEVYSKTYNWEILKYNHYRSKQCKHLQVVLH